MSAPTFSVLLCNYNYARYLRQCLAGVLRQSCKDFEIVLTDDGSTDGSQEIIREYAAKDARIKPHYFKENQGIMAAIADVSKRARGTYIFSHASDDFIVDEHFFAHALTSFRSHPKTSGFFGLAGLLSVETNKLTGAIGSAPLEGYVTPEAFYPAFLRGQIFVPGSSSIWRKDLWDAYGGLEPSFGAQTDFVLNHTIPCRHGIVFTKTAVTCQRIYDKPVNFGSKGTLWEAAARYAKAEERIRSSAEVYDGMESDWNVWRARWMVSAIQNTGVKLT